MIDLTYLVEVVIALIFALCARYVIPWLKTKRLTSWAGIAVRAAQQLFHELSGAERLEYALGVLKTKGFNIDSAEVRAAVEAEVLKLHQQLE